jgi:hypothetical protein
MKAVELIAHDRLKELLHYDPLTGIFTRKVRTAQRHQVGDRADFIISGGNQVGYYRVTVDSVRYMAHRLAWFYVHGVWPAEDIDHKDGDRGNNRIDNLRDVTNQVNRENIRKPRKDNESGFLGVVFHAPTNRWRARIQLNGKGRHIGLYDTAEEAHQAYLVEKRKDHEGCTI